MERLARDWEQDDVVAGLQEIAALLDKTSRRIVPVQADYVGFPIPDEFVVGYGLDYAERYRNIPEIQVLSD